MKEPYKRLLSVAAELVRGPNLDERFDIDGLLPKWATTNVDLICDRQRELCCIIRDGADNLRDAETKLRAAANALVGDLTAADEQPTHFSSWFALLDVLGPGTAGEEKP